MTAKRITLWVGNQPDPKDRTQIQVTPSAEKAINRLEYGGLVQCRDYITNKIVRIMRVPCGLECNRVCAIDFAKEEQTA